MNYTIAAGTLATTGLLLALNDAHPATWGIWAACVAINLAYALTHRVTR